MYGMVNNGLRSFLTEYHGERMWQRVCDKAGIPNEDFENLNAYDDAITYAMIAAVSEELDQSAEQVLETFGTFWVGFSKASAIGKLVDHGATTLIDQIRGLDEMHERVQMTMPHLDPPSFEFEEDPDGHHRLHYISNREGLAPMVVGLLHGMAADCGVCLDVSHAERREDGATHDVFVLKMDARSSTAA